MKLIIVSNGTKEGTFVRNSDTGEALEGVEHIAFNYDGEKCVTTVILTTGLVVNGQILSLPLTAEESRAVGFTPPKPSGPVPGVYVELGASVLPKPDPLAHCSYCKLYYSLAGHTDRICPESSDHEHKWVPPCTAFKPPPVLPTRVGYVAGKSEYVGKSEMRKEIPIGKDPYLELVGQYPHRDAYVLHARGTCEFCDLPSNAPLHEWRKATNTNYTGEHDPLKNMCPAELRRSKATIDKWYGNTAKPKDES